MRWRAIVLGVAASTFFLKSELLPIRTYSTADGLAADSVFGIVADSRGFLWFFTGEGLSRFDGYRFINYGVDDGLPHGLVTALIETRSGDHWVGTPRGLSRMATSGRGARFINYRLAPDPASNNIGALLETRSGTILAATAGGLFEWTEPSSARRRDVPGMVPLTLVDAMVEDRAGCVWMATTTGIYVLGPGGTVLHLQVRDGLPADWTQMLLLDSKGRMWAATRGGLAVLGVGPDGAWQVERVFTPSSGLVGLDVTALHESLDGTLWVGTTTGISKLSWDGKQPVIENLTRSQGLSDREIYALAEDPAGNIWAGTEGAGALRIDRVGFTTYREPDGLTTDRVFSVFGDRAGELLTVTQGASARSTHTVDIFDGAHFHSVAPGTFADHPTWGWDRTFLESRAGEWWAATKRGLCRYTAVKASDLDGRAPQICYGSDTIFRIFEDSKGRHLGVRAVQTRGSS